MGIAARVARALVGVPEPLPRSLVERFPELDVVRLRRGGLPPRVGGWALGRATVDAITLRTRVFLAPHAPLDAELLLHEARHVQQFFESWTFPLRYLWESVLHGYTRNRYEVDARRYASQRLDAARPRNSSRGA